MKTHETFPSGLLALVIGFILLAGGLFMALQPNEFEAIVRVDDSEPPPDGASFNAYVSFDPYFILIEFETMQSHEVLGEVVTSENLAEKWSKKYGSGQRLSDAEIEQMIRQRIELGAVPNTMLLEIRVFDDKPVEAAALANSIAKAYVGFRNKQSRDVFAVEIERLKKQIKDQEAKVKTLQQRLEEQKRELDISDETTASNKSTAAPYFSMKQDFETARRWNEILKQRLESFSGNEPARVRGIVAPAAVPSKPIRPNRPLGIAMLIAGLALIIVGMVFLRIPPTRNEPVG